MEETSPVVIKTEPVMFYSDDAVQESGTESHQSKTVNTKSEPTTQTMDCVATSDALVSRKDPNQSIKTEPMDYIQSNDRNLKSTPLAKASQPVQQTPNQKITVLLQPSNPKDSSDGSKKVMTLHILQFYCKECNRYFLTKLEIENHNKRFHKSVPSGQKQSQTVKAIKNPDIQPTHIKESRTEPKQARKSDNTINQVKRSSNQVRKLGPKSMPPTEHKLSSPGKNQPRKDKDLTLEQIVNKNMTLCLLCPWQLELRCKLDIHKPYYLDGKGESTACPICKLGGLHKKDLKAHVAQNHLEGTKLFPCEICSRPYPTRLQQKKHQRSHDQSIKHKCKECHRRFGSVINLQQHVISYHRGIKRFQCQICHKKIATEGGLKYHLKNAHENIPGRQCNECGKIYKNEHLVNAHMLRCHGELNVFCPKCPLRFRCKEALKNHMGRKHLESKDFLCHLCGKVFIELGGLRNHLHTHNEVKPYWMTRPRKRKAPKDSSSKGGKSSRRATSTRQRDTDPNVASAVSKSTNDSSTAVPPKVDKRSNVYTHFIAPSVQKQQCLYCSEVFDDQSIMELHYLAVHAQHNEGNNSSGNPEGHRQNMEVLPHASSRRPTQPTVSDGTDNRTDCISDKGVSPQSLVEKVPTFLCMYCSEEFDDIKLMEIHEAQHEENSCIRSPRTVSLDVQNTDPDVKCDQTETAQECSQPDSTPSAIHSSPQNTGKSKESGPYVQSHVEEIKRKKELEKETKALLRTFVEHEISGEKEKDCTEVSKIDTEKHSQGKEATTKAFPKKVKVLLVRPGAQVSFIPDPCKKSSDTRNSEVKVPIIIRKSPQASSKSSEAISTIPNEAQSKPKITKRRKREANEDSKPICVLCPETTELECTFEVHKDYHLNWIYPYDHKKSENLVCPDCKLELPKKKLRFHIWNEHTGDRLLFPCGVCSHSYPTRRQLTKHQLSHDDSKKLKCKDCHRLFDSQYSLKEHITSFHLGIKKYECHICNKKIATRGGLTSHIKNIHEATYDHQCVTCGKVFKNKRRLDAHASWHVEATVDCPHCDLKFKHKMALTSHLVVHKKTKDEMCHICEKSHPHVHTDAHAVTMKEIKPEMNVINIEPQPVENNSLSEENDVKDVVNDVKDVVSDVKNGVNDVKDVVISAETHVVIQTDSINNDMLFERDPEDFNCNNFIERLQCQPHIKDEYKSDPHGTVQPIAIIQSYCQAEAEVLSDVKCDQLLSERLKEDTHNSYETKSYGFDFGPLLKDEPITDHEDSIHPISTSPDVIDSDVKESTEKHSALGSGKYETVLSSVERDINWNNQFLNGEENAQSITSIIQQSTDKTSSDTTWNPRTVNFGGIHLRSKHASREYIEADFGCNYSCPFCFQIFDDLKMMLFHKALHKENNFLCCPVCRHMLPCKERLNVHMQYYVDHIKDKPQATSSCEVLDLDRPYFGSNYRMEAGSGVSGADVKVQKTIKYSCPYCSAVFDMRKTMLLHKALHYEMKYLGCPVCYFMFPSKERLIAHVKRSLVNIKLKKGIICEKVEPEKPIHRLPVPQLKKRRICEKVEPEKPIRRSPVPARVPIPYMLSDFDTTPNLTCTFCSETFPDLKMMELHKALHKENTFLGCPLCYTTYDTKEQLSNHIKQHIDQINDAAKPHIVDEVSFTETPRENDKRKPSTDVSFTESQKKYFKRKQSSDSSEISSMICLVCPMYMETSCRVETHKPYRVAPNVTSCPDCKINLPKNELRKHVSDNHLQGKLLFPCTFCPKLLSTRKKQITHERNHDETKKLKCNECSKRFHQNAELKDHYAYAHLGIKQFECNICQKRCSSKSGLDSHMKNIHEATFDHQCNICGKQYKTKARLKDHIDRHKNLRVVECSLCDKTFNNKTDLIGHAAVHRKTKDFLCDECGKVFVSWACLWAHLKRHEARKGAVFLGTRPKNLESKDHKQTETRCKRKRLAKNKAKKTIATLQSKDDNYSSVHTVDIEATNSMNHCATSTAIKSVTGIINGDMDEHNESCKANTQAVTLETAIESNALRQSAIEQITHHKHSKIDNQALPVTPKYLCDYCADMLDDENMLELHYLVEHLKQVNNNGDETDLDMLTEESSINIQSLKSTSDA